MGLAFISFKVKDCVIETLDEIIHVKQNLMGDRRYDKLNIEDWVVDQAYPPSDIIWADIEQVQENGTCKSFLPFINLSASFGVIFVAMFFDQWAFRDQ